MEPIVHDTKLDATSTVNFDQYQHCQSNVNEAIYKIDKNKKIKIPSHSIELIEAP